MMNQKYRNLFTQWFQWMLPGIGIKRWFLLTLGGTTLIGVGLGFVLLHIYRTAPETWWLPFLSTASLRFLARPIRAAIFILLGFLMIIWGMYGMNRSLMKPFIRPGQKVMDEITLHRKKEKGARIVAIGGGHGLATLLRGIKEYSHNITAIVSVADDGGSSGKIREEFGVLPPGDIRNCLAALSTDEALLSHLFQYRFPESSTTLNGHSFGNLFITALADIMGSFEGAIAESSRVLAVRGRVLPSTLHNVRLFADVNLPAMATDVRITGESAIPKSSGQVKRVFLQPESPPAYPESVKAILGADIIVIGPGSLYTSIIPNLLVPDISNAIRSSSALKIYVCNVATQPGETDHYTCADHIRALEEHAGSGLFDLVIANIPPKIFPGKEIEWVEIEDETSISYRVFRQVLYDESSPARHDSHRLAQFIMEIYSKHPSLPVD
jgi:uncharacterized cofD-like protein